MFTSLDRDESGNFFSRSRIKFLEVEYREMKSVHSTLITCCERCEALPDPEHPRIDGGNCLWSLVSWVACRRHRFFNDVTECLHCPSSQGSVELFTCTLSWALTPVTDPVSLHCHSVMSVGSMCSWTLPCVSSLIPSALHLSHGFQCSPPLNRQPYNGRLPLTSWWRKSSNMTVGQSSLISLTHNCYHWHPGSRCGWTCNQLTSKVDGGIILLEVGSGG